MRHKISRAIGGASVVLCLLLAGGCAVNSGGPQAPDATEPSMLEDSSFKPVILPVSAQQVFELSPEMIEFVDRRVVPLAHRVGARKALMESLYEHSSLVIQYDSEYTRTASQAFRDRRGNCLSLVIMTTALARHLNLPVHMRSVFVDEVWTRSKDISYVAGHVNLSLGVLQRENNWINVDQQSWIVDFLPEGSGSARRAVEIGESTVVAMFMNNRAAETLNLGRLDEAYAWVREAIRAEPRYLASYNTLGVIYRRHGQMPQAERVLRHVLRQEPSNVQALSNLALVLGDQRREAEREQLLAQLQELQPIPPFKYLDDGIQAMRRGEFVQARALFDKELARAAFSDEAHFWRALASYALRDSRGAMDHLRLAAEASPTVRQRDIYASKLASLQIELKQSKR